jgi:hypothetical protein
MGAILRCGAREIKINWNQLDVSLLDQQIRNLVKAQDLSSVYRDL